MRNPIQLDSKASLALGMARVVVFATVLLPSAFGQLANPQSPPGLGAATNLSAQTLSLAQAKEIAFEKNWDLLAAKSGIDFATAQLIVSKEFPNPTAAWSTTSIGAHGSTRPWAMGFGNATTIQLLQSIN